MKTKTRPPISFDTYMKRISVKAYGWKEGCNAPRRMYKSKGPTLELMTKIPLDEHALREQLKQERTDPDTPTDAEMELMVAEDLPYKQRRAVLYKVKREYELRRDARLMKNPIAGLELIGDHNLGDDVDILRTTFTRSVAEVEQEKDNLLQSVRALHHHVDVVCRDIPKVEKYFLGNDIRTYNHNILRLALEIKRKFYRKNMLETIQIDLDMLREFFYNASVDHPEWMTTPKIAAIFASINDAAAIAGGLLKTTVA